MLPRMNRTGYRQISSVFFVITLCCCFFPNVQGRTLASLTSFRGKSTGDNYSELLRTRRHLSQLEAILDSLNRDRNTARRVSLALDLASPDLDMENSLENNRQSRSRMSGPSLGHPVMKAYPKRVPPCYWNVVACYGKK